MRKERVAITSKVNEKASSSNTVTYEVKTNGSNLNVRSGNSTNHKIIGKVKNKSTLEGISSKGGWVKHNKIGKIGWSDARYLKKKSSNNKSSNSTSVDKEETVLTGTVTLREPKANLKAKTGVKLSGLGSKLSGVYFVEKVTHNFNRDGGYSQSLNVSRKWVGESIKGGASKPSKTPSTNNSTTSKKEPVKTTSTTRTYTIKKGDTLWAIAKKYYGKGSEYTKIYNANKNIIKNPDLIYPGQKIKIP